MRWLFLCVILFSLSLALLSPASADLSAQPVLERKVEAKDIAPNEIDDLCAADYQVAHWGECPRYGPGGYAERRRLYDLPAVLPPLATLPLEPLSPLLTHTYAKVVPPETPVFATPEDGLNGIVKRTLGKGFIYVSTGKITQLDGQEFVRINPDEYVRRGDLSFVTPSNYQGLALARQPPTGSTRGQPERPFAWVVRPFTPRFTPGGPANPNVESLVRYDVVQIYAKERVGDYDWYLAGRDQWVEQRNVSLIEITPPPEGVKGKWIAVNLYEQNMAVYEGERMVYASLISSGLGAWPTRPGLFKIYDKLAATNMSGAFAADKTDYYYLEDVPWVLYFDDGIAFHGTYWHDGYGFRKSHGCVNLSPKDSRWLYEWAEVGVAVYVYDPSGQTPTTPWTGGGP